jgi:hypothetical protein
LYVHEFGFRSYMGLDRLMAFARPASDDYWGGGGPHNANDDMDGRRMAFHELGGGGG